MFEIQQNVEQESEYLTIKTDVAQGSIFGPLLFYIYINDLSDNLQSNAKLFVNNTSMFSVVTDPIKILQKLNIDFDKVGLWTNKWKMSFNLDPSKQFFAEDK